VRSVLVVPFELPPLVNIKKIQLARAHIFRALEHHVLEQVGETRAALALIARANLITDRDGIKRAKWSSATITRSPLSSLVSVNFTGGRVDGACWASASAAAASTERCHEFHAALVAPAILSPVFLPVRTTPPAAKTAGATYRSSVS